MKVDGLYQLFKPNPSFTNKAVYLSIFCFMIYMSFFSCFSEPLRAVP